MSLRCKVFGGYDEVFRSNGKLVENKIVRWPDILDEELQARLIGKRIKRFVGSLCNRRRAFRLVC